MKPPHSTRPTQCPFCKTSNYVVEYRGVRTKEEKGIEQVEEQKVIEAQIRMRQQELQDAEERIQKRRDVSSSSRMMTAGEDEYQDVSNSSVPSFRYPAQGNEIVSSQGPFTAPVTRQPSLRQNRNKRWLPYLLLLIIAIYVETWLPSLKWMIVRATHLFRYLQGNYLSGIIPSEFGNLLELETLFVDDQTSLCLVCVESQEAYEKLESHTSQAADQDGGAGTSTPRMFKRNDLWVRTVKKGKGGSVYGTRSLASQPSIYSRALPSTQSTTGPTQTTSICYAYIAVYGQHAATIVLILYSFCITRDILVIFCIYVVWSMDGHD